jgi:hypothetical protein
MGCKSSKVTPSDNFFSRQALWIKEFAMFHLVGTASRKESCHSNPINTPMRSLGAALKGTWDHHRHHLDLNLYLNPCSFETTNEQH